MNLSEGVTSVLIAAHAKNTIDQYNVYVRKWVLFCKARNVTVLAPKLHEVLNFLHELYETGSGYSVVNSAKSALSGLLGNIEGLTVGQHPLVVKFMKGIGRLRPPSVKYDVRWDPEDLLIYLEGLPDNDKLQFSQLTLKLSALLALVTAQRVQTLQSIKIGNILWGNPVQISLPERLKTSSIRNKNPVLVLPIFTERPKLCVVKCLEQYVEVTKLIRQSDSLFISVNKPHGSVSTQTISRWLVKVLGLAGIDVSKYTAHSYRMTGSSQALQKGVQANVVMASVGWSRRSNTFARFYQRPIEDRGEIVNAILRKN